MIGYFLALVPLYLFVFVPLANMLSGPSNVYPISSDHQDNAIFNSSFFAPKDDLPDNCAPHSYGVQIVSRSPLVLYLTGFLSDIESDHLTAISTPIFATSGVSTGSDSEVKTSVRDSEVATPPRDHIVKCIESRALALQGNSSTIFLERLKVQKYGVGGHYSHHFDWRGGWGQADRVSSFMVYVDANCTGGGTEFPRLRSAATIDGVVNECLSNECVQDLGLTFKPVRGNAVFWENMRGDGHGFEETYHAGLPVLSGTKIGLNIWSWGMPANVRR